MDPTIRQISGRFATVTVFITVFVDLIGFGIVLPVLPSYASRLNATPSEIGALVASFSLMQFLVAPHWGRLSDRIGRRPVLLTGLAGVCSLTSSLPTARPTGCYWSLASLPAGWEPR